MKETPDQHKSIPNCTVYIGGEAWEIRNIRIEDSELGEEIYFTTPDGKEHSNFRNAEAFGHDQNGIELAIALSLNGYTKTNWESLPTEQQERIREKYRKTLSIVGEKDISTFYG